MSVYKPFTTSDVIITPFKVNKSFTFQGAPDLSGSGIDRFIGENYEPEIFQSGSHPTGDIKTQDTYLIYRSIRELYYSNYILSEDLSPVGTASFNTDGTITGPAYTPNYYNYLSSTLPANRWFPTGSLAQIGVISIPSNLFGEYIKPGTLNLSIGPTGSHPRHTLTDDGEGNILSASLKVGDIIYQHGMVILVSDGVEGQDGYGYVDYGAAEYGEGDADFVSDFVTFSDITCSFDSTLTIYENQYKCTIRENEYNSSTNPTLISGSSDSGVLYDYATGSFFSPYITTVGLYNNNNELVAIGKLAQPLPVSTTTDTTIMVNIDF